MCEICRQFLCPSSCPSYFGYSAELGARLFRCAGCGEWIHEEEDYIIDYGKPYCLCCQGIYSESEENE